MKRSVWLALAGIIVLAVFALALGYTLGRGYLEHRQATRGVALGLLPFSLPLRLSESPYGLNVYLDHDLANLERSLDAVQAGGFMWLRQRFPWAEIEPERGICRWETYDRIVEAATGRGLKIIAVLDTSPAWARTSQMVTAPPSRYEDYGDFVAAVVRRYRDRVHHFQIWDEPNIYPHWGDGWASAEEYVGLLKVAHARAKRANPNAIILAGGLAPTTANDRWNLNDIAFLRRMYAEGAKGAFDVLAAKPYGFWTGPDDRRADDDVLNFSRLILLREVMEKNNDGRRPIWAVEMGWNALPPGWTGKPSPWGSDTEEVQTRRTVEALGRAQAEWPWLGVMAINGLRFPHAGPDDPIHGFALLDASFASRQLYQAVQKVAQMPPLAEAGRYAAASRAANYSSGWASVAITGTAAGPAYRADRAGEEVFFHFRGTRVAILALRSSDAGRLKVWIDGRPAPRLSRDGEGDSTIELGKRGEASVANLVLASGLPDGEHTLRLQAAAGRGGTAVTVTGFEVVRLVSPLPRLASWLLLTLAIVLCVAAIAVLMPRLPWDAWGQGVRRLSDTTSLGMLLTLAALCYLSPWLPVVAIAGVGFATLALFRLDLALVVTALTFPFYLYPKAVGGQAFSMPEVLVLLCCAAWVARGLGAGVWGWEGTFRVPVLLLVAVAIASLGASENLRLSVRELRTVVLEPVLFYVLAVAAFSRGGNSLPRSALVWGLVLGASFAAGQAVVQYLFTSHVITAEGVRRALGPYGSPNNLGLLLERVLPLALALAVTGVGTRRRVNAGTRGRGDAGTEGVARVEADSRSRDKQHPLGPRRLAAWIAVVCAVAIAAALFLTYSVGAWLGAVAGLLVLAALRGRRQVAWLLVGLVVLSLALLPLVRVQRVVSHLGLTGESTTALRVSLWRSSLAMLADYPVRGVGLDGFLEKYRNDYIRPEAWKEPDLSHPHNLVLEWWLFLGIAGVGALAWLLVAFFLRAAELLRGSLQEGERVLVQGIVAAMTAAVVHGLVDRFYFGAPDLAFVFFGLLAAVEIGNRPAAGQGTARGE